MKSREVGVPPKSATIMRMPPKARRSLISPVRKPITSLDCATSISSVCSADPVGAQGRLDLFERGRAAADSGKRLAEGLLRLGRVAAAHEEELHLRRFDDAAVGLRRRAAVIAFASGMEPYLSTAIGSPAHMSDLQRVSA